MEGVKPPKKGPSGRPHKAGVDAGIFTAITAIRAPAQAPAGQQVTIELDIVNITDSGLYLAATAQDSGVSFSVSPGFAWVDSWAKYTFLVTFTMPNKNLRVNIYSWWWDGSNWNADDYGYVDIALAAISPEFRGFSIADYSKV